jgi:hypothetical protein
MPGWISRASDSIRKPVSRSCPNIFYVIDGWFTIRLVRAIGRRIQGLLRRIGAPIDPGQGARRPRGNNGVMNFPSRTEQSWAAFALWMHSYDRLLDRLPKDGERTWEAFSAWMRSYDRLLNPP